MKTLCIYHANCADGLGAAWAVYRALGDDVEFVAAKYGDLPPGFLTHGEGSALPYVNINNPIKGRDVLIVDFSYSLKLLRAMAAEARSVLVLDHHKTAQQDLEEIDPPSDGRRRITDFGGWLHWINKMPDTRNYLAAIFDTERSGAGITWDYLHSYKEGFSTGGRSYHKEPRPRIIDLIEDRDLWRFRYGDESRAFHAVLASFDITDLPARFAQLNVWDNRCQDETFWQLELLAQGRAILRAQEQLVASVVLATRRTMRIAGHVVPVANVPHSMASEACHLLIDHDWAAIDQEDQIRAAPFVVTYYDGTDGRRHFSLRSPKGGADVGKIAKRMAEHFNTTTDYDFDDADIGTWSGGGHEHAAGFDAPIVWFGE